MDHIFDRPSDFEFAEKDFETFSISPDDLLSFSFEAALGKIFDKDNAQAGAAVDGVAQARVVEDELLEGVATESDVVTKE